MSVELWQRKLAAFLHDPPQKAYDYSKAHEDQAQIYRETFGLPKFEREPDWLASAADRFVFPKGSQSCTLGGGVDYNHPFQGGRSGLVFPASEDAGKAISDVCPNFSGVAEPQERFFLVWRLWMEYATGYRGGVNGEGSIPYLPADTRIPDGTIWGHAAATSAIEGCRGADGRIRPAFLLLQIGPVQEFIAQARSTRDLWSGSYLLSWLTAHAIKAVADKFGPDSVIFPALRGQPIIDWLFRGTLKKAKYDESVKYWDRIWSRNEFQEQILTPTLPNRFLAVVPHDCDGKFVEVAVREEFRKIASECKEYLNGAVGGLDKHGFWDEQVDRFLQLTWQIYPWANVDSTITLLEEMKIGTGTALSLAKRIAEAIPKDDQDGRCYKGGGLNPGWAWSGHYALAAALLDARRQTRDFRAWLPVERTRGISKDDLSGKEEAVIDENWLAQAKGNSKIAHLFRKNEMLGAVNMIKRVWHKAYLEKQDLTRVRQSFESVQSVAAEPWKRNVKGRLQSNGSAWPSFIEFQKTVIGAAEYLSDVPVASAGMQESDWMDKTDAAVFYENLWDGAENEGAKEVQGKLRAFLKDVGVGRPSSYYAVLALDGDDMGKWVSGEKSPQISTLLTLNAAKYFTEKVPESKTWLEAPRLVSPSYHLQFSEALTNFSLYCARRIVESHCGQLIYAGGDDVLAMVPADEAVKCAAGLRMAFRGDPDLARVYSGLFSETVEGFVKLNPMNARAGEPGWPLLVPGNRAGVSVGLAIGHVKEPLQDMVQEAQKAEKRAKQIKDKDSLAVTLFKRSGETVEWRCKFESSAFALLEFLGVHYRKPIGEPDAELPISGKFPYRVCELLRKYEVAGSGRRGVDSVVLDEQLKEIAINEVQWAVWQMDKKNKDVLARLDRHCSEFLAELTNRKGTLADFYNLFAVEAFISRQGE